MSLSKICDETVMKKIFFILKTIMKKILFILKIIALLETRKVERIIAFLRTRNNISLCVLPLFDSWQNRSQRKRVGSISELWQQGALQSHWMHRTHFANVWEVFCNRTYSPRVSPLFYIMIWNIMVLRRLQARANGTINKWIFYMRVRASFDHWLDSRRGA